MTDALPMCVSSHACTTRLTVMMMMNAPMTAVQTMIAHTRQSFVMMEYFAQQTNAFLPQDAFTRLFPLVAAPMMRNAMMTTLVRWMPAPNFQGNV